MQEDKQPWGGLPIEPRRQRFDRRRTVALRVSQRLARARNRDRVVVEIESACDAGLVAEHVGGHSGAGGVARGLELLRERWRRRRQRKPDIVADAVAERQQAREK